MAYVTKLTHTHRCQLSSVQVNLGYDIVSYGWIVD